MAEPLSDLQCWVGKYEIRPRDELYDPSDGDNQFPGSPPNMPHLVQVGPARLIKPKRKALNFAVRLLLKTPMPKWYAGKSKRKYDPDRDECSFSEFYERPVELDAEEFSRLEKHVLQIARTVGMLWRNELTETTPGCYESLERWIDLLIWIHKIFKLTGRKTPDLTPVNVGELKVFVAPGSLQVRPNSTYTALIYCAAEMAAHGIKMRTCDNCGTAFLEGGDQKRTDARFCSDKCRYDFHNEARRKAARKTKL